MKKTFKTIVALIMGAVMIMAFRCQKEDLDLDFNYNARHSECLTYPHDATKDLTGHADTASVVYDAATQCLHVTHYNLYVNCGTAGMNGGITVSATRRGQTIDIYEYEDDDNPQADCMCHVNNEFDLYSIEHGTYTLIFHSSYPDPMSVTFSI